MQHVPANCNCCAVGCYSKRRCLLSAMSTRTLRHALVGYAFLLPSLAGFALFTLGPIVFSLLLSFFHWNLFSRPIFVDMANYLRMFADPSSKFWDYTVNSLFFLLVVPFQMGLALLSAYLLEQRLRGTFAFKVVFFLPVVLSAVPVAIIWEYILNTEHGLLNVALGQLGIPSIPWLYHSGWIKPGISLMVIWQGAAFSTIIYYAALQGIPSHLYEVATLDGAGAWRQFWSITMPLLGPTHLFLGVTGVIAALQLFAPIYVMTHGTAGGAHNLLIEVYWTAYHRFDMGYASALSWVLFLMIFGLSFLYWKSFGHHAGEHAAP